jgi:uncharacterized protein (TIGR00255 family)
MTGFGIGEAALGEGRVLLELRALNHRFLDVRVRLPSEIAGEAFFVEQLSRERLSRGRFDVGVRLEGAALPPPRFALERARAVYRALVELRDELSPASELPVAALTNLPDLVTTPDPCDVEALRRALGQAFDAAITRLDEMRRREGEALRRDLVVRLRAAEKLRTDLEERSHGLSESYRARLEERLARLLGDASLAIERGRLEAEVAILADRSDVTEELVRLGSHFEQFERLLARDEPIGRRLDFLLQEIAREANTIGAKCQSAGLSHVVVELKAEIERMREQVQNVE